VTSLSVDIAIPLEIGDGGERKSATSASIVD
jgi:hypothetical protein